MTKKITVTKDEIYIENSAWALWYDNGTAAGMGLKLFKTRNEMDTWISNNERSGRPIPIKEIAEMAPVKRFAYVAPEKPKFNLIEKVA